MLKDPAVDQSSKDIEGPSRRECNHRSLGMNGKMTNGMLFAPLAGLVVCSVRSTEAEIAEVIRSGVSEL